MSLLPDILTQELDQAHRVMMLDPQHDVSLGYRRSIWALLGPHMGSPDPNRSIGLRRRVNLAILATQRVLPIWNRVYPCDNLPCHALDFARQVLDKTLADEIAWEWKNSFWSQLVQLGNEDPQNQVVHGVGFSAVQALTATLRDEVFSPSEVDLKLTDADVDPSELDSSFFSAAAYSHGAVWDPYSNSSRRKGFWEWWLKYAVPAAWKTV